MWGQAVSTGGLVVNEERHAFLLLACVGCRRVNVIAAHPADLVAGRVDWDDHRLCPECGEEMAETERGKCGHILLPGEDCQCRS